MACKAWFCRRQRITLLSPRSGAGKLYSLQGNLQRRRFSSLGPSGSFLCPPPRFGGADCGSPTFRAQLARPCLVAIVRSTGAEHRKELDGCKVPSLEALTVSDSLTLPDLGNWIKHCDAVTEVASKASSRFKRESKSGILDRGCGAGGRRKEINVGVQALARQGHRRIVVARCYLLSKDVDMQTTVKTVLASKPQLKDNKSKDWANLLPWLNETVPAPSRRN